MRALSAVNTKKIGSNLSFHVLHRFSVFSSLEASMVGLWTSILCRSILLSTYVCLQQQSVLVHAAGEESNVVKMNFKQLRVSSHYDITVDFCANAINLFRIFQFFV